MIVFEIVSIIVVIITLIIFIVGANNDLNEGMEALKEKRKTKLQNDQTRSQ